MNEILNYFVKSLNLNWLTMKHLLRLFILLFVFGILVKCEKDEPEQNPNIDFMVYEGNSGEIGIAGGEIRISDSGSGIYGTKITIPEGALSSTETITISDANNLFFDGKEINVIEFGPEGLQFSKLVKVGLPFAKEDSQDMVVYWFRNDNYSFQELDLIEIDYQNNIVYANTEHFSLFAVANFNDDLPSNIGTFVDERDGLIYRWVKIGAQIWMAENLAYLPFVYPPTEGSETNSYYYVYTYNGTDVNEILNATDEKDYKINYQKYGALYNWPAAMSGSPSSNNNPSEIQGICPTGWHLPSDEEWKELEMSLGMSKLEADKHQDRGTDQGIQLKNSIGWYSNPGYSQDGTNSSGFSALPGGTRSIGGVANGIIDPGFFGGDYQFCDFWSSTEKGICCSFSRSLGYNSSTVYRTAYNKGMGFSIRCVKD